VSKLGDRNWYLPSWLAWLPRLDLDRATREPALRPVGAEPERELVQVD